jgi:hypothetical protein
MKRSLVSMLVVWTLCGLSQAAEPEGPEPLPKTPSGIIRLDSRRHASILWGGAIIPFQPFRECPMQIFRFLFRPLFLVVAVRSAAGIIGTRERRDHTTGFTDDTLQRQRCARAAALLSANICKPTTVPL